jgi:TonB family protein
MNTDFKTVSSGITLCLLLGGCAGSSTSSAPRLSTQPIEYADQSNDTLALVDEKMRDSLHNTSAKNPDPKRIGPWVTTKAPRIIFTVIPTYPDFAANEKVDATVLVGFVVTTKGEVADAKVINSSDHRFDDSALKAVRGWQFWPAVEKDIPVEFPIRVPIVFKN